ncbi:DUF262 domain-containing protein [Weissella confusa]|uniref:DUF262 domain-containing protein n=1 Tax=Weissella fermenti TaxID=2987699 RepID=A0ABT6D2T1_9LACO|nr:MULTISPECIES: DUF262 domain-containing protein [Weissella]MBJ7688541.1 DUF262 domain-containing protein [Weissella confusa]MCW0927299.1 DUF262 domain-containing protein [Weissella sp. LMG 11983]MDF9299741.1 DUF262 domain-containing protein [Weissella sp. BK2]
MGVPIKIPQPAGLTMEMLFQQNVFSVPVYQRNYSWKQNEVLDFWRDLEDLIEERRNNHFFGQVVTFNHDNIQDLIDGQQRMTTSTIFLAVIRDTAQKMLTDEADQLTQDSRDTLRDIMRDINQRLIRGENGEQATLKLQVSSESDRELQDYFYKRTHSQDVNYLDNSQKTEPMKNMDAAYLEFQRGIDKSLSQKKTLGERINLLDRTLRTFIEKFYVVMISAPTQRDAFIIFETLNSRGADLKPSDIIKNHIMFLLEDDLENTNLLWAKVSDQLNADSDRITSYIRSYWTATRRLVTEGALYRSLSQELNSKSEGKDFLDDLVELVHAYDVLENPWSPVANRDLFKNRMLHAEIDILDKMSVKLYYPIFLSMRKQRFDEQQIAQVLHQVISIFVRHRTILNNGTNTLESGFATTANKIYRGELTSVNDINTDLKRPVMLHSDADVLAAFSVLSKDGGQRGQKKWALTYLLSELAYADNEEDYYEDVFREDKYELVRIAELNDMTDDVDTDHESRIGNWTLIEKAYKFDERDADGKYQALHGSLFPGNDVLAEQVKQGWNNDAVDARQNKMSDNVVVIWQ